MTNCNESAVCIGASERTALWEDPSENVLPFDRACSTQGGVFTRKRKG